MKVTAVSQPRVMLPRTSWGLESPKVVISSVVKSEIQLIVSETFKVKEESVVIPGTQEQLRVVWLQPSAMEE